MPAKADSAAERPARGALGPAGGFEGGFRVRALGEIAIRCAALAPVVAFYRDVIGLEILEGSAAEGIVFFRLGESHGGHTAVLALFAHDAGRADLHERAGPPVAGGRSSLHHLALTVDAAEQSAATEWYDRLGVAYNVQDFDWIGWRGVFAKDPEANTVELVAKVKQGETVR
ncbi:MAG: VOC family protein [Pseudomonadota bacterium]